MPRTVRTVTLEIGYQESGPADGPVVVLLHGFPDDVHVYDGVAPICATLWMRQASGRQRAPATTGAAALV